MNKHTSAPGTSAWLLGGSLLLSAIALGLNGILLSAAEGNPWDQVTAPQNTLYSQECGACHMVYVPELLPAQSWQKMLADLEDHFGDNAELDEEDLTEIAGFLEQHALGRNSVTPLNRLKRKMPEPAPLRVSELPYILDAHQSFNEKLGVEQLESGFLSPCKDCHKEAEQGIFDKNRIYQGYGAGMSPY